MKLWESIKNSSDFDTDRNRRRDCTGKRERISVNNSDGRSAIGMFESNERETMN